MGFRERAEVVSYYLEKERGGGGAVLYLARELEGGETEREKFF